MTDEDAKVTMARHDERLKTLEKTTTSLASRLWAVVLLVVAWVANQLLGIIGGPIP